MAKCGEKTEVYSRVTGYFRPVSNWNKGKQEEFKERKVYKVGKAIALLFGILTLTFAAGCGHNAIQYGDGVGFDFGINPENWTCSFTLRYGKILSACVRENTEFEIVGGNDTTGNGGDKSATDKTATGKSVGGAVIKTESSVKAKIGRQITGYYVDAIKAGAKPEDLQKYVDGGEIAPTSGNDSGKAASAAKTAENAK